MRLAIYWYDLLPYHIARVRALAALAPAQAATVKAFILCAGAPDLPAATYQATLDAHMTIFSQDAQTAGEFSHLSKRQLLAALDQFQPDAVAIIGYTGPVAHAALGWCRRYRRGAVLMLSSQAADFNRIWWKEWPKRQLVSLYDAAIVSGQAQAAYARQLGLASTQIWPGYGVVDNEFWQTQATATRTNAPFWREHYGLPAHFFLTVCRFVPKKNLAGLLNAYATYVRQCDSKPWSLVLVGDGELGPALRQQVIDLQLTGLVHFLGHLQAADMAKVYGLASAFILASAYAEQWGLVVNEAMAAGLPVLVSNICGCVPDLVYEGETGFTFTPTDTQAIAGLLTRVASGQIDLHAMGCKAQAHIAHYSPQQFAQNLFAAAEAAMHNAQARRWPIWPRLQWWR